MRRTIFFEQEAVYHLSGDISSAAREIWFVLHGYGQLPQYFVKKFSRISNASRVMVAPGGLSRFYLNGYSGRVGSTWMTSEERLLDIENYIKYLNKVAENVLNDSPSGVKIVLLGFSQGCATVCRWVESLSFGFDKLILHSGAFPPDIDFSTVGDILTDKEVYMLSGDRDDFINEQRRMEQSDLIQKLNLKVHEINFEGGHEIHIDSLLRLIAE